MKRALYILTTLLLPLMAWGNGDPTAMFCALTLSKAPVPRAIPEIQIERENLHITFESGQSHISVDYILHNTSSHSFRNIHYGFPVDWTGDSLVHWEGDFFSESQRQVGWSDDYVRDFSFSLNGKALSANMSGDTIIRHSYTNYDWHRDFGYMDAQNAQYDYEHHSPENPNDPYNYFDEITEFELMGMPDKPVVLEDAIYRRWYYTSFSIAAHKTVTLHVEYILNHTLYIGLYSLGREFTQAFDEWDGGTERKEQGYNIFHYDLSPAAAWGDGTAHELDLTIEAPDTKVYLMSQKRDSCLFEGYYHQHYTNFQYATANPLEYVYYYPLPDSLDVNAIRDHRLSPSYYTIQQYDGDTCSYAVLSDLDGCSGIFLTPNASGCYVLEIKMKDTIPLTGIAILNGRYCDSLSWYTTPRAQKMMVQEYGTNDRGNYVSTPYCLMEWKIRFTEANYYPALCKTIPPTDFSWPGLVKSMEKMNINNRRDLTYTESTSSSYFIRIFIPYQEEPPFISEIILLGL